MLSVWGNFQGENISIEEEGIKLKKVVQEASSKELDYAELITFSSFLNQITFLANKPSIMYENDEELLSYLLVKKARKSVIALPGDYYQLEAMQLKRTSKPGLDQKFHYVSIIGRKSNTPNYNFSTYEHNTKNILLLQEN